MALQVKGKVLGVEHIQGTSQESGQAYSYVRTHVLAGLDVLRCRVADGYGPVPAEGQEITAEVAVSAYKSKSGAPVLSYTLLRPVAAAAAPASSSSTSGTNQSPASRAG